MSETFQWPIPNISDTPLGEGIVIDSVNNYLWMVVVGGILAFIMAWGIGANDVANAFATSVGAGSLSLLWACAIAAVMEFAGALLLGGSVTDTVRKRIIEVEIFDPNNAQGAANGPEMLMTGFLIALLSASVWLIFATYFALPVSTTHSIIGSLVGVGLAYRGGGAINWWEGDGFDQLKGVGGVILSWVISPVLSAIFAVIFFIVVRSLVLRRSNPYKNGLLFMPLFYGVTVALAIFFIIYKGDNRFKISEKLDVGPAIGIALGTGAGVAVLSWFIILPLAKRSVERWAQREEEKIKNPEAAKEAAAKARRVDDALSKVGVNVSIDEELEDDVIRMHDNVEKFDAKTERLFTWVQVFTAGFDSFAHGANDVANSVAPFASIFQLFNNNGVITKANADDEFSQNGFFQGGNKTGDAFEEGDDLLNHNALCGKISDTKYFSCNDPDNVIFPFLSGPSADADQETFTVYDENGVATGAQGQCHTQCNARNAVNYEKAKQDVPLWILVMGGAGIVLGLAMWGYRIILAIGVKLTKLTPSRGFAIEIGAALTVLIASRIGIPVSTTHCQVGATMGVGLVEFKKSTVNWKQFFFICVGWVFTVVFTGLVSAVIFLIVTRSPQNFPVPQGNLEYCPGNRLFIFDEDRSQFRGIACSG